MLKEKIIKVGESNLNQWKELVNGVEKPFKY